MKIGMSLVNRRTIMLMGFTLGALSLTLALIWDIQGTPLFTSVKNGYSPSDISVVDAYNVPLETIRTKKNERSLAWVSLSDVSPSFKNLLIETEDKRFYQHFGLDLLALGSAVKDNLFGKSKRGASTITMQLTGLLEKSANKKRRSPFKKIEQIYKAVKIDSKWSKTEVLESYINLATFRGEVSGLRAASQGYFGKNPSGLTKNESALLIALLRSPNASAHEVSLRACRMVDEQSCTELKSISEKTISKNYQLTRSRDLLPIVSKRFITSEQKNSIIETSLSYAVQETAMKAIKEQLRNLRSQNVQDAAALVLETKTGRVVAYAANGGTGYSSAKQIDGIQMRRQAGSTIKPFVYATAFDLNILKENSLIDDSPADISVAYGKVYHPRNYDKIFRGLVAVNDALGSSMNVPAVRTLQLVGETAVLDHLRELGFKDLKYDEYYGPSLALGTMDVTLWELTQGYRQLYTNDSPFSELTRKSIFNILASPENRRFTFGTDSILTLPFPAAVKTGTSKDMRDNWCIGFTADYTVGVWIGNFNGEPMWNVSGMSGAAPIWRDLMMALHPNPTQVPITFEVPDEPLPHRTLTRIKYPAPNMLVGFDPDIPKLQQKLPIEIDNPQKGQNLYLNDHLLSKAQNTILWSIERGKYRLELKTAKGEVVDVIKFEVR